MGHRNRAGRFAKKEEGMKLSTHSRRITKLAAAALAVAAVAAPATQAANRPDDRPGMQGATPAVAVPDVFERAAIRGHVNLRGSRFDRPDNRPGMLGVGTLDRPAASYYTPEALKADGARLQGQVAIYAGTTSKVAVPDVFERAVLRGPQGQPSLHPNDRPGQLGPGQISAEPSVSTGGGSFDWSDALVGGGAGIGIALLLFASAMAVGSHRRRVLKSA
jgi:hypothetical protein